MRLPPQVSTKSGTISGQHASFNGRLGVLSDNIIELTSEKGRQEYPKWFRMVRYYDKERDKTFEFITNNLKLSGKAIADIYKSRWQIEAFFKWIKQNLKIKTFLGTGQNAVLTQIWAAMCYYLLVAYMKYQSKYSHSMYYLHRLIRSGLFERISFIDLLSLNKQRLAKIRDDDLQLTLAF